MCDYSLHAVVSRPAKLGDQLKTTQFRHTLTRGFSAADEPNVAVCLLPGTELAFEAEVQRQLTLPEWIFSSREHRKIPHKVGRFRQVNIDNPATHHDAIEFPDGQIVLVTRLRPGQCATVLQLPVQADATFESKQREHHRIPSAIW